MISDTQCQFFLRTLLQNAVQVINGKQYCTSDVTVLYENIIQKKLPKGIIIQENYVPLSNSAYTDEWQFGSCFYNLVVYDDKDSGIRIRQVIDDLLEFFQYGEYKVGDNTYGIVINKVEIGKILAYKNDDKVFVPVDIYFDKIS